MAERRVEAAIGQLRPGFDKGGAVAVQRVGAREQAPYRPVGQHGLIFVAHRQAGFVAGVSGRSVVAGVPQNNSGAIRQRGLSDQTRQRFAQRGQIGLL